MRATETSSNIFSESFSPQSSSLITDDIINDLKQMGKNDIHFNKVYEQMCSYRINNKLEEFDMNNVEYLLIAADKVS